MDLADSWRVPVEKMEQFVKGRRSVRRYLSDPVSPLVIEKLLDIVRYAPTGMNVQQVQWQVYLDQAELKRLTAIAVDWLHILLLKGAPGAKGMIKAWERGEDRILRNAPHLIIAHGKAGDSAGKYSSVIALTTLELAALSFGLGACWAGFLFQAASTYQEMFDALDLPPGHIMYGGLVFGYPEFEYARIPARKAAKVIWK